MTDNGGRDIQAVNFAFAERVRAAAWKGSTTTLPAEAREPAPYVGQTSTTTYPFCVPVEYAVLNLLPEVRVRALDLFAELGIPWHHGVAGGPSNHLLSSQVQSYSRLAVHECGRPPSATSPPRGPRSSRSSSGSAQRATDPASMRRRRRRVVGVTWPTFEAADGPVRSEVVTFEAVLQEPFYQLVRQQLLVWRLERDPDVSASTVRVVHVLSPHNAAYQRSVHVPVLKECGDTVMEIWEQLLRTPIASCTWTRGSSATQRSRAPSMWPATALAETRTDGAAGT